MTKEEGRTEEEFGISGLSTVGRNDESINWNRLRRLLSLWTRRNSLVSWEKLRLLRSRLERQRAVECKLNRLREEMYEFIEFWASSLDQFAWRVEDAKIDA